MKQSTANKTVKRTQAEIKVLIGTLLVTTEFFWRFSTTPAQIKTT